MSDIHDRGDARLDRAVRAILAEPTPDGLADRVAARATTIPKSVPSPTPQARRWLGPAVAAAILLASAWCLLPGRGDAAAQVAEAVGRRPWLHAVGSGPDGPVEVWYSARTGVLALRVGPLFRFSDHARGVADVAGGPGGSPGVVSRVPLKPGEEAAARRGFEALLRGDLRSTGLSGGSFPVEETTRTVSREGREYLERRIVARPEAGGPLETTLLLDPASRLPVRWAWRAGDRPPIEMEVSYPEAGPASIFALGVPADARVVDLVPKGDLARVLASLEAGRRAADDYVATAIESLDPDFRAGGLMVRRVIRKGDRRRVDLVRVPPGRGVPEGRPADDWWLRTAAEATKLPRSIAGGGVEWTFEPVYAQPIQPDPADPDFLLVESLRRRSRPIPPDDPRPRQDAEVVPEWIAYPILEAVGRPGWETRVEPVSGEGPPGAVLVASRRAAEGLPPRSLVEERAWVDPARGGLVARLDRRWSDGTTSRVEVVEAVRTPRGSWLPRLVRTADAARRAEGGPGKDVYMRVSYEFDAPATDALFDPEAAALPRR